MDKAEVTSEAFRWRPNLYLLLPLLGILPIPLAGYCFLTGAPVAMSLLPTTLIYYFFFRLIQSIRLALTDSTIALRYGSYVVWRISWPEITELRYESARLFSPHFDRLVLKTSKRTRALTFNDRLAGRWERPERILRLLRERGYSV